MNIDQKYLKQALLSKLAILPLLIPGILTSIFMIAFKITFYPYVFVIIVALFVKAYPYLIRGYPFQKKMFLGLITDIGLGLLLLYYRPIWMWILTAVLVILMMLFRAVFDTVAYSQLSHSLNEEN